MLTGVGTNLVDVRCDCGGLCQAVEAVNLDTTSTLQSHRQIGEDQSSSGMYYIECKLLTWIVWCTHTVVAHPYGACLLCLIHFLQYPL